MSSTISRIASAHMEYDFCPKCGAKLELRQLKPGDPKRHVCPACEFVFFLDPKVAAGAIFTSEGKIVLARRAIHPGYGKWVFPGGFVDRGETVECAAVREAWEEVHAKVELRRLIGVYSYRSVPIVVIVYAAEMVGGHVEAADECLEVHSFAPEEIPWEDLAFSSIRDGLRDYVRGLSQTSTLSGELS